MRRIVYFVGIGRADKRMMYDYGSSREKLLSILEHFSVDLRESNIALTFALKCYNDMYL